MKRVLNLLLALLVITLPLFAGDVFIDGNEYSDVDVIQLNGLTAEPSTAPLGNARVYYNSIDDKVYLSKNGDSYSEIGAAGNITAVGDVASGDAFTGSQGNTLYFEGTTSDDYEIALTGADATADRTITLPDATGTLLLKDQIDTEAEFESLLFSVLTPSEALLLDQSTPQTISNDTPLLDTTPTGAADIKSLVNKEYVDLAVTSLGAVYYMYDEDDATGYKTCYLDPSADAETYIEKSSLADDDYIGGWISASGEEPTKLLKGVYNWYLTAEKTTGTQELRIYWKLVERKSDDSETVIATSSNSNIITDKGDYIVPLQLSSDYLPDSGSRIVGKLYADISGGGNAPTVRVYYQGSTSSRWEIPANSEIFKNIFVPYDGAVKDVDLGSYGLTTTGDITAGNLNISNWDTAYSWGDHSTQNYLDLDTYPNTDTDSTDDLTTSTSFSGDVSGTYNSISVNKIKGKSVDDTNIADGKVLKYNSTSGNIEYQDDNDTAYTADGEGIELSGTQFSLELDGTTLSKSASGLKVNSITSSEIADGTIQNADIADDTIAESKLDIYNAPTDGYYLKYTSANGMEWAEGGGSSSKIQDADADTYLDTEETSDKDEIVGKVAGVEALRIYNSGIIDLPKQSGCRAYLNADQSVGNEVYTKINFGTEVWDTQNEFDPTTNHRFTVTKAGKYLVTAGVMMLSPSSGQRFIIAIYKNGTKVLDVYKQVPGTATYAIPIAGILDVNAGDYIEIFVWQNSGGNKDIRGQSSSTWMCISKLN